MAKNTAVEDLISLRDAAEKIGRSYETVWRYAVKGFRGVRLETVRIGGTMRTSREAINRFIREVTETYERPETVDDILGAEEVPR